MFQTIATILAATCLAGCANTNTAAQVHPERVNRGTLWQQSTPHPTDTTKLHTIELNYYDEPVRP